MGTLTVCRHRAALCALRLIPAIVHTVGAYSPNTLICRLALHSPTELHTPTQLFQHFRMRHPTNWLETTQIRIEKYAIESYTIQDIYH